MAEPPSNFRAAIRSRLQCLGWTAYRLHRESGVSKSSVYAYLNGEREMSSNALEQLCRSLDLDLRERHLD